MSHVQKLTYRIGVAEGILENIILPPYKKRGKVSGEAYPLR